MIDNIYKSASQYVKSATTLEARIAKIGQIIDGLLLAMAEITDDAGIEQYSVDTGQSKIQAKYRNQKELSDAIEAWSKIEEKYLARYNNKKIGRVVQLTDRKSFNR